MELRAVLNRKTLTRKVTLVGNISQLFSVFLDRQHNQNYLKC